MLTNKRCRVTKWPQVSLMQTGSYFKAEKKLFCSAGRVRERINGSQAVPWPHHSTAQPNGLFLWSSRAHLLLHFDFPNISRIITGIFFFWMSTPAITVMWSQKSQSVWHQQPGHLTQIKSWAAKGFSCLQRKRLCKRHQVPQQLGNSLLCLFAQEDWLCRMFRKTIQTRLLQRLHWELW